MLIKIFKNKRGISLPMVIGLVSLILIISVGANELIVRAIRSVQKIEASDKAYFAAEAGVEDALYELSPHFAGYQTPVLTDTADVRKNNFQTGVKWDSEWTIQSHENTCTDVWDGKQLCGKFYENQKLIISLFNDNTSASDVASNGIGSSESLTIDTIRTNPFSITFRLPTSVVDENDLTVLTIDNDGDKSVNEDVEGDSNPACANTKDADCDGSEDEDSPQDPVIYWKISDNAGNTFTPARGCSADDGSEICEKDFTLEGDDILFTLPDTSNGVCDGPAGGVCDGLSSSPTISDFLDEVDDGSKLQIEFNIVAPLEHTDNVLNKVAIPYLEYGIVYAGTDDIIPTPYFTIESDGYFRDFKQSITAKVSPKTAVPLFDFTIIQQQ
jgi:hypothetical protein